MNVALAREVLALLPPKDEQSPEVQAEVQCLEAALEDRAHGVYRVLVAGPMSVGKSSLTAMLWGHASLLPTAVRDCTQTNSLIRVPRTGESDQRLLLHDLVEQEAVDFALRGLSYYRVLEVLTEAYDTFEVDILLKDLSGADRIQAAVKAARDLFKNDAKARVLYDHLDEALESLEEFLTFLKDPMYAPDQITEVEWSQRERYLMGLRGPDYKKMKVGRLLTLGLVELVKATEVWKTRAPHLIDSPMIPAIRNARRADLLLRELHSTDVLLVVALPQVWQSEPWLETCLQAHPDLASRTLLIFNQLDTVDRSTLFGRSGLAGAFRESGEHMTALRMEPGHLFLSCARLPFLKDMEKQNKGTMTTEFRERLEQVLKKIQSSADIEDKGTLRDRVLDVCRMGDGGIGVLREKIESLGIPAAEARTLKSMATSMENLRQAVPDFPAHLEKQIEALNASVRKTDRTKGSRESKERDLFG